MSNQFFITGTGTGVGKTLVSAILTEARQADYWKPVQAGLAFGTDSEWVANIISNGKSVVHPEAYRLKLAASPHIASREENIIIDLKKIVGHLPDSDNLIIEGAGGLMVPLNGKEFIIDLIKLLRCKVILVSKNELGSINHSLLTASVCHQRGIEVAGWIFNGDYINYENEIVQWSGIPKLASIPHCDKIDQSFISAQADIISRQFNSIS